MVVALDRGGGTAQDELIVVIPAYHPTTSKQKVGLQPRAAAGGGGAEASDDHAGIQAHERAAGGGAVMAVACMYVRSVMQMLGEKVGKESKPSQSGNGLVRAIFFLACFFGVLPCSLNSNVSYYLLRSAPYLPAESVHPRYAQSFTKS